VFLGLRWNPDDPSGNLTGGECIPEGKTVGENMVSFHVLSFSSFLFSSLIALCLKQTIRIVDNNSSHGTSTGRRTGSNESSHHPDGGIHLFRDWNDKELPRIIEKVNKGLLRAGIMASAVSSVFGCGFLMLALVNVVQIKLGRLGCSGATAAAVVPLVILVPVAMLIYISIVFYAFTRSKPQRS